MVFVPTSSVSDHVLSSQQTPMKVPGISEVLLSALPLMSAAHFQTPQALYGDGHRAIFGLGPYIADYPEQVWLAGIVYGWCPK